MSFCSVDILGLLNVIFNFIGCSLGLIVHASHFAPTLLLVWILRGLLSCWWKQVISILHLFLCLHVSLRYDFGKKLFSIWWILKRIHSVWREIYVNTTHWHLLGSSHHLAVSCSWSLLGRIHSWACNLMLVLICLAAPYEDILTIFKGEGTHVRLLKLQSPGK